MVNKNSTNVSAVLNEDLFDFIEDFRWANRKNRAEIVVEAIEDWAVKRGYKESPAPTDREH